MIPSLALAFLLAAAGEPAGSTDATRAKIDQASIVAAINAARAAHALPPVFPDARLDDAARDRMDEMLDLSYWQHRSPDGTSPFRWLRSRGFDYRVAGENLAAGFETAGVVLESWLESPGHRANVLSREYSRIGVAVIDGNPARRMGGRSVIVIFASERAGPVEGGGRQ